MDLTIVVASVESEHTLKLALDSLLKACADIAHEIVVVDASRDRSASIARKHVASTAVHGHAPGTLVPDLWADGIRHSRGRHVALTTGHCVVPPGWAHALIDALRDGAAGAGAGLVPRPGIRALDLAVFFLRYSAFLEITRGISRATPDIPGDNAAYQGDGAREFVQSRGQGFWEVEYHRWLKERGGELLAVPEATAAFGVSFPFRTILRHRYDHGRQFGAWRACDGGEGRLRVFLPSPLVPFVFLLRTALRLRGFPELTFSYLRGSIPFFVLAAAWASGEGVGALFGPAAERSAA